MVRLAARGSADTGQAQKLLGSLQSQSGKLHVCQHAACLVLNDTDTLVRLVRQGDHAENPTFSVSARWSRKRAIRRSRCA